jgi:hypothetical protein
VTTLGILIGIALQTLSSVTLSSVILSGSSPEAVLVSQDCETVALEAWSAANLANDRLMGDDASTGYQATGGCTPYSTGLEVYVQGDLPE